MPVPPTALDCDLTLPNHRRGKVRDVFDAEMTDGRPATLLVASDRLSAFDVVMPTGIPHKGRVLTALSTYWFALIEQQLGDTLRHHLLSNDAEDIAGLSQSEREAVRGRVMLGTRCRVVPIECVVRGYLAGSGWKEYQKSQTVCGVALPAGLRQCDKLPHPIFTPATKAAEGHDENISYARACELVGEPLMRTLRDQSLRVYQLGHDHAASRGIILADTKFEFGQPIDTQGQVTDEEPILIDEALTPDSSRFWPADSYEPGRDQASFDKQFVRNYLENLVAHGQWHKTPPGPTLPDDVVTQTTAKYVQAYEILTGQRFDASE